MCYIYHFLVITIQTKLLILQKSLQIFLYQNGMSIFNSQWWLEMYFIVLLEDAFSTACTNAGSGLIMIQIGSCLGILNQPKRKRNGKLQQTTNQRAQNYWVQKRQHKEGIADSKCSDQMLPPGCPVLNIELKDKFVVVGLPNTGTMVSRHSCTFGIPSLPPAAKKGHLFKKMQETFVSILGQLSDTGHTAQFDATSVAVRNNAIGKKRPRRETRQTYPPLDVYIMVF